ncbi:MAG: spirocyclase AveC family protein [Thermoleophilaceae bacterium]
MESIAGRTTLGGPVIAVSAARRRITPVKWWAAVGASFLALIVYLVVAWIASGDAKRTPTGADPVPRWMHMVGIVAQIAAPAIAVGVLYWFVIRPLRRKGRISFDGLLALATATVYWQDPLAMYTQPYAAYNADLVNLGSWAMHIPGWQAPNMDRFAEPLLFAPPVFLCIFLIGSIQANVLMRRVKGRWPSTGNVGLIALCFGFMALSVLIYEGLFVRLGLYHYGGVPGPKLFGGSHYQYPMVEVPLMAAPWTAFACLRYFRDEKGHSVVERGIDRLRTGAKRKTGLRFLAVTGICNVIFLIGYNIPAQWIGTHANWIDDVVERSYFTNGICGPGTAYACPGPGVPIARPDSAHLDPDRRLVSPSVGGPTNSGIRRPQ